ncbi:hypothetical protein [Limnohabitans sp. Rim8]|uniref:hypothetical protein n=1 Tax=Limnohabitans sp. Rim8 TaxID=1100718 RepID=UPI0033056F33
MKLLFFWRPAFLCAIFLFNGALAWAARPMVTDDANVVDPHACQNESWVRFGHSSIERWTVPGCNFFGDTEISVGANFLSEKNSVNQQLGLLQVKKRWKVVEPGQWGLSTTVGRVQSGGTVFGISSSTDTYVNIPITWPTSQGPILHLNLGAFHHQAQRVTQTTWGLGAEVPVHPRFFAIMEAFGEAGTRSKVQIGLRYWVVPQAVQIDTTMGQEMQGPSQSRWLSLGLRLLTPALY